MMCDVWFPSVFCIVAKHTRGRETHTVGRNGNFCVAWARSMMAADLNATELNLQPSCFGSWRVSFLETKVTTFG